MRDETVVLNFSMAQSMVLAPYDNVVRFGDAGRLDADSVGRAT